MPRKCELKSLCSSYLGYIKNRKAVSITGIVSEVQSQRLETSHAHFYKNIFLVNNDMKWN